MSTVLNGARTWRPLLSDDDRDRALVIAREIGCTVKENAALDPLSNDPTLSGGLAGVALLFAYLNDVMPGEDWDVEAAKCLKRAVSLVATTRLRASLYSGFTGVAWALTHIDAKLRSSGDRAASIDHVLLDHLSHTPWKRDYDLIEGLTGFGVYALERCERPLARACAEAVVARLGELAKRRDGGVAWHTPPEHLPPHQFAECPNGYFNLGLAHGIPGPIAVLAAMCDMGISTETARPLLRDAVGWLLASKHAAETDAGFSAWIPVNAQGRDDAARIAWCYGDLGLGSALLVAARSVSEPAWEEAARAILRRAARRPDEQAGVVDAGLCHGSAGVAHLFNRAYQRLGDEALGAAARTWIQRTIDMRQPGRGVAGYRSYFPTEGQEPWIDEPGLLTGSAGIALALLAAATDTEPIWDRLLLTSVRPRGTVASRILT